MKTVQNNLSNEQSIDTDQSNLHINTYKSNCNIWILKPADQSRGRGIYLFDKLNNLNYDQKSIVQKYIPNPLLIGGYKFDLRIYAILSQIAPFIVYINSNGLVRFATEKYDLNKLTNIYAHLTNASININGPSYGHYKDCIGQGCKWTIDELRQWMRQHNLNDHLMWTQIQVLIVLILLSQASSIPKVPNAYEIFGFDILIDSNLQPWLIEVNANPSISNDCLVDEIVKKSLIKSVLKMLAIPTNPIKKSQNNSLFPKIVTTTTTNNTTTTTTSTHGITNDINGLANNYHNQDDGDDDTLFKLNIRRKIWSETSKLKSNEKKYEFFSLDSESNRKFENRNSWSISSDLNNELKKLNEKDVSDVDTSREPSSNQSEQELTDLNEFSDSLDKYNHNLRNNVSLNEHYQRLLNSSGLSANLSVENCNTIEKALSCPLYGEGSELLITELLKLIKEYGKENFQSNKTNHSNGKFFKSNQTSKFNQSRQSISEKSSNNSVKCTYSDRYLIPHSFDSLKLAFPFNRSSRISCACEKQFYPNLKLSIAELNRLVTHVRKWSNNNNKTIHDLTQKNLEVIDIPLVWN